MKSFYRMVPLWGLLSFIPMTDTQAQNDVRYFFQKGATYFTLNQHMDYSFRNLKFDGNDIGEEFLFSSRLNWNRALSDNFGVGATDRAEHSVFKDNFDFRGVNTTFRGTVGAAYAFELGDKQLITDLQVGYGQVKNKTESGGTTTEFKDDFFLGRLKAAYPVQLYQSDLFLVPNASFLYKDQSGDNQDEETRSIGLGLDLYASVPCNGWWYNDGVEMDRQFRYTPGTQMWGNGTKVRLGLSDITRSFNGGDSFEENRTKLSARADYSYYLAENFAIGFKGSFTSDSRSPKDSDFKTTTTSISFTPRVRWHPLKISCWQDVYLEGSGGFATNKIKTQNGSTGESKQNSVLADAGVGKFVALTPNLFLNPSVHYSWSSSKDPDDSDDQKLESTGVGIRVGISYSF